MPNQEIVSFLPSQIDTPQSTSAFITTKSPFRLLCSDVALVFSMIHYFSGVIIPLKCVSDPLDELTPSWQNFETMAIHIILMVVQAFFILSIPFFVFFPGAGIVAYCGIATLVFYGFCSLLNKSGESGRKVYSDLSYEKKEGEVWLFVNGIAVGEHWLKCSLNRLSKTFHRPIIGISNPTYGILFDLIQCLIQRDLSYNTPDVRATYTELKLALRDPSTKKVVLIAHSQGGIIASMALDWLYAELPSESALRKLEVYTFGCAANHFNNPIRSSCCVEHQHSDQKQGPINTHINHDSFIANATEVSISPPDAGRWEHHVRVVPHIEHYSNGGDMVGRIGVLHFTQSPKHHCHRYIGRVFERVGVQGHMLNQHYLDTMFPVDQNTGMVLDHNTFMDAKCAVDKDLVISREQAAIEAIDLAVGSVASDRYESATKAKAAGFQSKQVREFSRLFQYTNGKVPDD